MKVRGLRIELGEIESHLATHGQVLEAAVSLRPDPSGEKRLIAHVAVESSAAAGELATFLARRVPAYMVPEAFVDLDALPRTASGKVDRAALPDPEWPTGAPYVAPRTSSEELVAGIFSEVLQVERIGAEDAFFELGGHSLLATQAMARIRQVFGVELALRELFEAPAVAQLARRIEAVRQAGTTSAPPLVAVPRDDTANMPLSFAQQRLWFLDRLEPESSAYNIAEAFDLDGALDLAALARALNQVVRRHEVLRASFCYRDGEAWQRLAEPRSFVLPVADLSALPAPAAGAERQRLIRAEERRPFDLARGPLFRFTAVAAAPERHALLISLHHIVSDGWSMTIFFDEVATLYRTFAAGRPPSLGDLPVQYLDYAVWQRGWLRDEVLAEQLGYWRRQLEGAPQDLPLPLDRPRPAVQTFRGAAQSFRLGQETSAGFMELARREKATLFMATLAAFCALLQRYTGRDDLLVGTLFANRDRLEIQRLIGFFVSTLTIRADLSGRPTYRQMLARIRETCLESFAHTEVPFERIVEELRPQRDLSRSPLFQVMFDMISAAPPADQLEGLAVRRIRGSATVAKFDLVLSAVDAAGRLDGSVQYNADLFDPSTIRRLLRHFATLLAGIVADPELPVDAQPLLDRGERQQLIAEWNGPRTEVTETSVLDLFNARVARAPDAVAIVCGERSSIMKASRAPAADRGPAADKPPPTSTPPA